MADIPDNAPIFEGPPRGETGQWCLHDRYTVVYQQRLVTCNACGATLDPFVIVERWARGHAVRDGYRKQVADLQKKLVELHAEERRIKARTRNARRKDADLAVQEAERKAKENHERTVYGLLSAQTEIAAALKRLGYSEGNNDWRVA